MNNSRSYFLEWSSKLLSDVEQWARELDWSTRRVKKTLKDEAGKYESQALIMQHETNRIMLEPVGLGGPEEDAYGIFDIYLMPGYDDIARILVNDQGSTIHYLNEFSEDHDQRQRLDKESLNLLMSEIVEHVD